MHPFSARCFHAEKCVGHSSNMKIKSLLFASVVVACASLPSRSFAEACLARSLGWNFGSEGPWHQYGRTRIGKGCGGTFGSPGGGNTFKRLFLLESPQHGTVFLREGGYYYYVPQVGFMGQDRFMLRVCATLQNGQYACANLIMNMTVTS